MHQPVTDNPFVIMVINMVIVFAVLTAVWGLIELTHIIDPTKKKAEPAAPPQPAAAPACGCSPAQIKAVRPAEQPSWSRYARVRGMR